MLLRVEDLRIQIATRRGVATPVDGVNLSLEEGRTLGIVGESGCGKSLTSLALLRLLPPAARIISGRVLLDDQSLLDKSESELRSIRGRTMSMILQDPTTSLNPVFSIGNQVSEAISLHEPLRGPALRERVVKMLRLVGIPSAESRLGDYPHQLSGGMRQRVAGSIALASGTLRLLIADEPTTALDATVQAQYLDLLRDLQTRVGFGLIFISHDIGVVAELCDRIAVMYAGRVVESGPTSEVIESPRHPYTKVLLQCIPRLSGGSELIPIAGEPPNPLSFPPGCRFAPRCPRADVRCHAAYPEVASFGVDHQSECWYAHELC